jgi:3-deoxy-7-phosphoheptulonate synthase/chorismate mutase
LSPTETATAALTLWREKIDALNLQLLALLENRGRAVDSIMALKQDLGVDTYDPNRESAMLAMIESQVAGPYSREQVGRVFRTIFEISRELGRNTRRLRGA